MARHASLGTMMAATALIAWPVLAQTTGGTTAPPPSPMTTERPAASPGMGTATTAAPKAPIYFTADRQVRVSKVVGASVYNEQNQSIGSIDDLLMSESDKKAATAVISVGGFLGMGAKLVSVPFDQLKIQDDRIVMPGATKASLEGMPEYQYTRA